MCPYCEHYGRLCLQEDSLMTAEARQRCHADIKRKLPTQCPVLEVAQDEESTQAVNLDDWSISFKEFQPKRSKQPKKQISKTSQEKMELPQPLADNGTQLSFNQPQPKVVQPSCDPSPKKDTDVQAIPPRVVEEQKSSWDGRIKRVMCYKCGEKATMPIDVTQNEKVEMGMLDGPTKLRKEWIAKECVSMKCLM